MFRIVSILWVIFTSIIIIVPVFYLSYFLSKKIFKFIKFIAYKIFKATTFQYIRKDILSSHKFGYFNIREDIKSGGKNVILKSKTVISRILLTLKMVLGSVRSKIYELKNRKNNMENIKDNPTNPSKIIEQQISSTSKEEKKDSSDFDFLGMIDIDIVSKDSDPSVDKVEDYDLSLEEREKILKNKKMIEKIIYESLVFKKEGRFDEYEKKIIEGLAIDPDDKELNKLLAEYYFSVGNHRKALSLLKKIVDMDHKDHKAIWQIGEIYLVGGEYEVAEILINRSISMNNDNPRYYASLVELLYNTDRKSDAIEVLENKLLKLRPGNMDYLITLAELYEEEGQIQNAKKYYFRILEQDPSNEKIKRKLQKITDNQESIL